MENQNTVSQTSSDSPPPLPSANARASTQKNSSNRGCLRGLIIAVVALIALGAGILIGAALFFQDAHTWTTSRGGARIVEELVREAPGVRDKIAVIDVKGIILSNVSYDGAEAGVLRAQLKRAASDPHVVGVVLDMDTPGGEVTASDEIHQAVQAVRDAGKPVVACMRSVCASGGYYIASAADFIVANQITLTGSIGVIIPRYEYQSLLDKIGIHPAPYKSGRLKDMLSGGTTRPESEQQLIDRYMQELIDTTFHRFATVVADGRPAYETADDVKNAVFADGRILLARDALDYGLVDKLGYFEDAINKARELAGIMEANLVQYRKSYTLRQFLFGASENRTITLDSALLQDVKYIKPRNLYYLMPQLGN
ncbi:MAG: signal peptide peptidase SppA [Candidatus Pacebacteria bacterium]|nr:signal peptide peptidase SppA [Candidatus Paceibacterota bacterium]